MVFSGYICIYFFNGGVNILKKGNKRNDDLPINEQIRASEVMVIGPNGEKLGIKNIKDARTLADYAGFDLVAISPNSKPPVCKIMDYNKYRYEKQKQNKENMKKQREANLDVKEYRLSVNIDKHDFDTRVKNAYKYLEKGHKVKAAIRFKGRQIVHPEYGKEVLFKFASALEEVAEIEKRPAMDGRVISMILMPKKDK